MMLNMKKKIKQGDKHLDVVYMTRIGGGAKTVFLEIRSGRFQQFLVQYIKLGGDQAVGGHNEVVQTDNRTHLWS